MSKEEWKESGAEMGHAWTTFGKTFIRSAKTTTGKVTDWAEDKPKDSSEQPESTVYSDGSWKQTGKELGGAFAGMGKTLLHSVGLSTSSEANANTNAEADVAAEKETDK